MSENPAQKVAPIEASSVNPHQVLKRFPMQVSVTGKILRVRRHEQKTYTVIVCAAADQYSQPEVVEIRSDRRFGDKEEVVTVLCRLGGWQGKAYKVVDKETGERLDMIPVNLRLDLIEDR